MRDVKQEAMYEASTGQMLTRLTFAMEPWRIKKEALALLVTMPGAVIAGGYARNVILPGAPPPADIDVFLLDGMDMAGDRPLIMNALGYTAAGYRDGTTEYDKPDAIKVQTIERSRVIGEPLPAWRSAWDVIKTFGFTTEMFSLHMDAGSVIATYTAEAEADTSARVLRVNHIIDPVRLVYRMNKYGRKGYTVTMDEVLKAFSHWSDLRPEIKDAVVADTNETAYRQHINGLGA